MSNPPSWLMWFAVIATALYVLDIVLRVTVWVVTETVFYFKNKKRTNHIPQRDPWGDPWRKKRDE